MLPAKTSPSEIKDKTIYIQLLRMDLQTPNKTNIWFEEKIEIQLQNNCIKISPGRANKIVQDVYQLTKNKVKLNYLHSIYDVFWINYSHMKQVAVDKEICRC